MMRRRLRPMPTDAELARMYTEPHQHKQWPDHVIRVDVTSALAHTMLQPGGTVADLSCGDGTIARRLGESHGARLILGDYAPGYEHTGPIERTIKRLRPREADLFICSETLEHLDDPDSILADIRLRTDRLIVSTPDDEEDDRNPQHIWAWDSEAVEKMLRGAGFTPMSLTRLDLRPDGWEYCYQIWCLR